MKTDGSQNSNTKAEDYDKNNNCLAPVVTLEGSLGRPSGTASATLLINGTHLDRRSAAATMEIPGTVGSGGNFLVVVADGI